VDDPGGPPGRALRVSRGGCWNSLAGHCRSAYRFNLGPGERFDSLGFRVTRVLADK
jgi:formylglycine-generating enzyme required for sulfatase activity